MKDKLNFKYKRLKIIFFSFLIVVCSLSSNLILKEAFAQTITPIPTPTPVDYQLPYPGLLPDNPLYKLKTLRDKIIFFLISDPLKKAQFDLLQSDKRVNSAWYLLQAKTSMPQLIIDTLSKGQNYFEQGLSDLSLARKQGYLTKDILRQFFTSIQKHREVIKQMKAQMPQFSDQFNFELNRIESSIKILTSQGIR